MEKKEDRRIAMTKRLLKAALIELLKEQDIYHISIRELCERADVNRTTFYKYYGSQFDLLTDMEKDMLDFIAKAIERHETEPEKIITAACRYLAETNYTIGEISAMLGFCDQSFFSTAFRKRYGVSPVEYRRSEK